MGHYREMVFDPRFSFRGYFLKGQIVAATGWLISGESAVVSFCKHLPHWWLAEAVWADILAHLFSIGAKQVNVGETSDGLKRRLGFSPVRLLQQTLL